MAVFDIFKRLVNQNTAPVERRTDDRVRATLGARVLVVDDSATIRAVLGKMLVQDGYEVLKAPDGESAVEMAQAQYPDLIFLDIVLPGMSGFAVLRALRRESATRMTPIIMMSGNQQATEQFYVQRFGADGFIKKPFGRAEVFHAVRSLVQAGRMPARVEAAPAGAIPEGMTAEEWNAIPDVAMPDDAHMHAPLQPPAASAPAATTRQIAAEATAAVVEANGAEAELPVARPAAGAASGVKAGSFSFAAFSARIFPTLAARHAAESTRTSSVAVQHLQGPQAVNGSGEEPAAGKKLAPATDEGDQ